ncbi:MAG: GNAT family N-acetyltransferase [Flavobacteriales bacterium]|nr:GNAT family N-acetyltransferase [Flavobacteriales bacterium]
MSEKFIFKIITKNSNESTFNIMLENAAKIHNRMPDSVEWLKWKYFDSPFGECITVIALSSQNEFAGEFSFGLNEFIDNGKTIKVIYAYQTMVHPNFQKKGLFKALANQIITIAKNQGVSCMLYFPNTNSLQPALKFGFKKLNHLKYYVTIGRIDVFLKQFNLKSLRASFVVDKITEFKNETLSAFEMNAKQIMSYPSKKNILYPKRTYEFLKWRYFTFPMHAYEIITISLGWAIVRVGKRSGFTEAQIMEVFPTKGFSRKFIGGITKEIRKKLRVGLIVYNMSETHPLKKQMLFSGYFSLSHNLNFCVFPINETGKRYLQKENWIITATEFHRY